MSLNIFSKKIWSYLRNKGSFLYSLKSHWHVPLFGTCCPGRKLVTISREIVLSRVGNWPRDVEEKTGMIGWVSEGR